MSTLSRIGPHSVGLGNTTSSFRKGPWGPQRFRGPAQQGRERQVGAEPISAPGPLVFLGFEGQPSDHLLAQPPTGSSVRVFTMPRVSYDGVRS